MHKTFRFVLLLLLWSIGLIVFYFFLFRRPEWSDIQHGLSGTRGLLVHVRDQFKHTDSWNWILISFVISLLVLTFSFNDVILWRTLKAKLEKRRVPLGNTGVTWLVRISFCAAILGVQIVLAAYILNISISSPYIYDTVEEIKSKKLTVLVLGTSKYISGTNQLNRYFVQRMEKTIHAYRTSRVHRIILSGDKKANGYDETRDMLDELIAAGVPRTKIFLDTAGFRTFDSIKRLKVSDIETIAIISQSFHLERALFLARAEGLMAIGLAADGTMTSQMFKRELLAKTKVLLDIYILNTQSHGIAAKPRRPIQFTQATDVILMLFVLLCVGVAGQLSRNLLTY